jgi:hypothetical protein
MMAFAFHTRLILGLQVQREAAKPSEEDIILGVRDEADRAAPTLSCVLIVKSCALVRWPDRWAVRKVSGLLATFGEDGSIAILGVY